MDRPEDVEVNPKTSKVYLMLTNNNKRKADQVDAANPRADNLFGHIVELTHPTAITRPPGRLGHPGQVRRSPGSSGPPSTPTPGQRLVRHARQLRGRRRGPPVGHDRRQQSRRHGRTDGVWAMETEEGRGTSRLFFRVPDRSGDVRAHLHARRQDLLRRRSAPGRGGPRGQSSHLEHALDPVAGLRATFRRGRRSWSSPRKTAA